MCGAEFCDQLITAALRIHPGRCLCGWWPLLREVTRESSQCLTLADSVLLRTCVQAMEDLVQFTMAAWDHYNEMFCFVLFSRSPREKGEIQKHKQNNKVSLQRQENGFLALCC